MIMKIGKQQHRFGLTYGLVIPATLFMLSVTAGGAAFAAAPDSQTSSQATGQAMTFDRVYRVGRGVSAPVAINFVNAKYPKSGLGAKDKFEGMCLVGLVVDASGAPRDVHITRSLRPAFDANAIKAVQQYRFTPAMRSGKPVAVSLIVEVNFKNY